MTPAAVTVLGGICGIVAGHLYFYRDLRINVVGMLLHVCANVLDNADGQLARLTHRESRNGRIIDSVADHLIFVSVYLHLTLRCACSKVRHRRSAFSRLLLESVTPCKELRRIIIATPICYLSEMGALAIGLDSSSEVRLDYRRWSWRQEPWKKLLLALYLNFTRQQEMLAPHLKKLRDVAADLFQGQIPAWLRARYRNLAGPMLKWWGLLMTNTRMLVLFAVLLISQPIYFFWFELIPLNVLFVYLIFREETMAESMQEVAQKWRDLA